MKVHVLLDHDTCSFHLIGLTVSVNETLFLQQYVCVSSPQESTYSVHMEFSFYW